MTINTLVMRRVKVKLEMKIEEPTVQEHDKACGSITVEKDVDVLL